MSLLILKRLSYQVEEKITWAVQKHVCLTINPKLGVITEKGQIRPRI